MAQTRLFPRMDHLFVCSAAVKFGLDVYWCLGSLVTTVTTCHDWPDEPQCSMWPAVPVPRIKETHSFSPGSLLILCFSGMFCGLGAETVALLKAALRFLWTWEGCTLQPGQGSIVLVWRSTSLEVSGRGIAIGRHHTGGWQAPTPSLAISHVWHRALPGAGARILQVHERVEEIPALH